MTWQEWYENPELKNAYDQAFENSCTRRGIYIDYLIEQMDLKVMEYYREKNAFNEVIENIRLYAQDHYSEWFEKKWALNKKMNERRNS